LGTSPYKEREKLRLSHIKNNLFCKRFPDYYRLLFSESDP